MTTNSVLNQTSLVFNSSGVNNGTIQSTSNGIITFNSNASDPVILRGINTPSLPIDAVPKGYADLKVSSVSGTTNRISISGTSTDPIIDISSNYVGQTSITTLGTIGFGTWNATNIGLNRGGTGASLAASNGGIFYSTATAGAILAGTGASNRVLLSGNLTVPSWSTATYPSTTGANRILYSTTANTLGDSANLIYSGGILSSNSGNTSTSVSTGDITTTGGIGITRNIWVGSSFTNATSITGTNGAIINIPALTYTNTNANSATVTNLHVTSINQPTIASTGTSTTVTNSSSLYIAGAPIAGTNVTMTNRYAIQVAGGELNMTGNFDTFQVPTVSTLIGTGAVTGSNMGLYVAISPDGLYAAFSDVAVDSYKGAVWIYTLSGGVWTQQTLILATNVGIGATANFGRSMSFSSDATYLAIGASRENGDIGATYVFIRSGVTWEFQQRLLGSGNVGTSNQGVSVSLDSTGAYLAVGGSSDSTFIGATWIFTRSGVTWTQQGSKLTSSAAIGSARQGASVSFSSNGSYLAIGGWGDNGGIGATWIYKSIDAWQTATEQTKIVATDYIGAPSQGFSVDLNTDGSYLVIGGNTDNSEKGASWVYTRSGETWSQQVKLVGAGGSNTFAEQQGFSVSINGTGNRIVIGAPNYTWNNTAAAPGNGCCYLFSRNSRNVWYQEGAQTIGVRNANIQLNGYTVSLNSSGSLIMQGTFSGRCYIYNFVKESVSFYKNMILQDNYNGISTAGSITSSSDIISKNLTSTNIYGNTINIGSTFRNSTSITGTNGAIINIPALTYTNTNADSAIITNLNIMSINQPTIASSGTSTTVTNTASLYIAGAPVLGNNINPANNNRYALQVATGDVILGTGRLTVGGTVTSGNPFVYVTGTGSQSIDPSTHTKLIAYWNGSTVSTGSSPPTFSSGTFTIQQTGNYCFGYTVNLVANTTLLRQVYIRINNSPTVRWALNTLYSPISYASASGTMCFNLAATNTVDVYVFSDTESTNMDTTTPGSFWIMRI